MSPLFLRARRWAALAVAVTFSSASLAQVAAPQINARAWILYDYSAQTVLGSLNSAEKVEPASLTKLMTAYLVFSALKAKTISENQNVTVTPKAWKTGGSRMYIEPNRPVTVAELLRGMIIQSGNDASVALAELVSGSEEQFAQRMTAQAKVLGMKNTVFKNATGLPDKDHLTTAEDMALLAAAIFRNITRFTQKRNTNTTTLPSPIATACYGWIRLWMA
jgi:serine-type D-Ala-D-Ala carboxypeptidase (penicillin-binding protein 5/6)